MLSGEIALIIIIVYRCLVIIQSCFKSTAILCHFMIVVFWEVLFGGTKYDFPLITGFSLEEDLVVRATNNFPIIKVVHILHLGYIQLIRFLFHIFHFG